MNIRARFMSAIKRGTGEAHEILQKNPSMDFSSEIIKACLRNYAYDPQSEGSRAVYISELIDLSNKQEKILKAIAKGISQERQDTWALEQLFDLAAIYAKRGNKDLRRTIYKRFFKKHIPGSEWCGYSAILDLDKLEGLQYIATTLGKWLERHPDANQDGMIIEHFEHKFPAIDAKSALRKASRKNRFIKGYLDNIKRTEKRARKYKRPVFNVNALRDRIANAPYLFIPPILIKSLSKKDIIVLADDLLTEKDEKKLERYLAVFSRVKFPYGSKRLLEIAEQTAGRKRGLRESATGALKFFSGKNIRQLALSGLSRTRSPELYTDLLIRNYRKGDSRLLSRVLQKAKSDDAVHDLVSSYVSIYKKNRLSECRGPLLEMYNRLTCGIHRYDIVKILLDNKVLPSKLRQEIKCDSFLKIRKLS